MTRGKNANLPPRMPFMSIGIMAVLLIMAIAGIGCKQKALEQSTAKQIPSVRGATVETLTIDRTVQVAADVSAESMVMLLPEVGGAVTAVSKREGDMVKKGEVVVEINDRETLNLVAQAEAASAGAEAGAVGAAQAFEVAERHYERMKKLRDTESISQGAYDEVRARYDGARAANLAAQAQLKAARAQLSTAQKMLEDVKVRSPLDGYVAKRYVNPGSVLQTMPPTELLLLVQVNPIRVRAEVGELDFVKIKQGMSVTITFDALPDEEFTGEIAMLSPMIDPASRTGAVEVVLPNPEAKIRPGMAGRIIISLGTMQIKVIPRTALVNTVSDRKSQVFVLEANSTARRQDIELNGFYQDYAVVVSGVEVGDQIISRGLSGVSDGVTVRVEQ